MINVGVHWKRWTDFRFYCHRRGVDGVIGA